jgi:hypothetical protein
LAGEFSEVTEIISPQGGKISIIHADNPDFGETELFFPPGSVEKSFRIAVKKLERNFQPSLIGQTAICAYEFNPDASLALRSPAQLFIRYDDEDGDGIVDGTGVRAKDLKIFWLDHSQWRFVGGKLDESKRTLKASLSHLSTFALFPAQANEGDFHPKEKIITPALKDGINDRAIFDGLQSLSEPFRVEIFDVGGRRVKILSQVGEWDGTDDQGRTVESGVYLYQVHVNQKILTGTITVAK